MSARNSFPTDPATDSLTPRAPVGFLRFPAFSLGPVGKPGWGVRPREPKADIRKPSWDFSIFRPFPWDAWQNRGWGHTPAENSELGPRNSELVNQLATFHLQFSPVFPQVTWAYFVDSIHHVKKLHRNSDCDINHYVSSRLRLRSTIFPWPPH